MRIDILTLFPGMFQGPLTESIVQRAREQEALKLEFHDLRQWGLGKYRQVDDTPYGGGPGMVLKVDVLVHAIEDSRFMTGSSQMPHRILFSPRGKRLTQGRVEELSTLKHLLLLCGHYEGVDQRIVEGGWIDEEISIGDYVLTGGELPAMVLIDAMARQIPGVIGKEKSAEEESFSTKFHGKREYPHYTRPEEFRGLHVPDVLLSGHHAEIEEWRTCHLY
ncbi:tRNA (guanosine(37)-N1)-methyltransferase TrmD [Candidatus Peribacteria bacterium RIFCSPHIGHO2_02_FULL_49_16]|nr:MAG: tRNA (guanosine(37)-N1)-methyltransferase TrmD [Candidatus Peribacteria bacterium RIFCSPHIGHO2_01_FULL_49_38]OGJ58806.1 MAG: tRNA (guanosine(37)-N1)-methyltransferase TrmD [Candidatus Peribacteria bacterium RIFCSPHIGHO2_02_FULL_49_16]